jgi:hypothetical protein
MAEVRPIPSAVGAFEAQVLNMNKAYNFLMQNAAAERKQSAALRKQVEDDLYSSLNDKRVIRSQDAIYIESLKKDAEDYFFKNKSAVLQGGEAYNELRRKMGLVTNEVTRSMSAKEQQNQIDGYAKGILENAEKGLDVGSQFKEGVAVVRLPINDKKRKEYIFKNQIGDDVGIEQLSINELERVAYFSFKRLDEAINDIQPNTTSFEALIKGKDVETKYNVRSPLKISEAIVNTAAAYPGMEKEYEKLKNTELQIFPDLQERMNKSLPKIISAYETAGASTPGSDFGSVASLFEQDGVQGIDINNPYEYALYKKLEANLPIKIGMSYSYKSQANAMASDRLKLMKSNHYFMLQEKERNTGLDEKMLNEIRSGNFKPGQAEEILNAYIAQEESGLGAIAPAKVSFDEKNKTMTTTTNRMLFEPNNAPVDNFSKAQALTKGKGQLRKYMNGQYYVTESKTISIDKNSPSLGADFSSALDMAEDVMINNTLKKSFNIVRKGGKTRGILQDLED